MGRAGRIIHPTLPPPPPPPGRWEMLHDKKPKNKKKKLKIERAIHRRQRRRHRIACRRRAPADENGVRLARHVTFPPPEGGAAAAAAAAADEKRTNTSFLIFQQHSKQMNVVYLESAGNSNCPTVPTQRRCRRCRCNCGPTGDWQLGNVPRRRHWSVGGSPPAATWPQTLRRHWPLVFQINDDWPPFPLYDNCINSHPLQPSGVDNRPCLQVVSY